MSGFIKDGEPKIWPGMRDTLEEEKIIELLKELQSLGVMSLRHGTHKVDLNERSVGYYSSQMEPGKTAA